MPNRLAVEKSPYLLQHADNPVDWYPWGDEAFLKALRENKPIFLSIGYSTCHWCHVMAHESFEDAEVAALLNEHFVSVKVDREERPDIDQVYMTVCQATTGSGGWPLSIFMGNDKKPFLAGSYFPKRSRLGMPGLIEIAHQIATLWKDQRSRLEQIGEEITRAIQPGNIEAAPETPGRDLLERAHRQFSRTFDPVWGGFGKAPKFPTPHNLSFLLRRYRREPRSDALDMVQKTLLPMRFGGIFDQIGFGFHRYSVDEKWLVPHFEKMLYDQALLAVAYLDMHLATGALFFARVAREIFEYVLRDMKSPEGGFYSAEDADSEGREGVFYTWTPKQVEEVLGKSDAELFCRAYGITEQGNFEEETSIPHIPRPFEALARDVGMGLAELENLLDEGRKKLFSARTKRVHPQKDDKILTAWNGLMIAALSRGAQALGEGSLAREAAACADFLLNDMRDRTGRLLRAYRGGEAGYPAYAEDYAFLIWGLIELYETVFDVRYLGQAVRLQEAMNDNFWDSGQGGYFFAGTDNESLIVREKTLYDGAVPSSNSVAALNLLRLGRLTGNTTFEEKADALLKLFSSQVSQIPPAYAHYLQAVDFALGPTREIVVAGDSGSDASKLMVATVHRLFLPNRALLVKQEGRMGEELAQIAPFTAPLHPKDGASAFVCENFQCRRPIEDPSELESFLESGGFVA